MADRIFRAFCSLKLTLANLFAIFLAMVAGTFVNPGYAPQLYATGLQIARDPSTPIIYAGCFFLFVGCAIAFYTAHKRIWARVTPAGVELGGAAHRNADAFRLELEEICAGIGLEAPKQGAARAA